MCSHHPSLEHFHDLQRQPLVTALLPLHCLSPQPGPRPACSLLYRGPCAGRSGWQDTWPSVTGFSAQCDVSKVHPCCSLCPCIMPFFNSRNICPCMKRACLFIPSFISPCPRYAESYCQLPPSRCRWRAQGSFTLWLRVCTFCSPSPISSPFPVPASGHHQSVLCIYEFGVSVCLEKACQRLYRVGLALSDLFTLAKCPQAPSVLLQMAGFPSFLWLNNLQLLSIMWNYHAWI